MPIFRLFDGLVKVEDFENLDEWKIENFGSNLTDFDWIDLDSSMKTNKRDSCD